MDTTDEGWICSMLILNTPNDTPTAGEIDRWSQRLVVDGRAAVAEDIVFSDASVDAKVSALYETQLGREPDPEAVAHWRSRMQADRSELPVEYAIFASSEYLSQFESPEAFVNAQYQYYLGREASIEEREAWAQLYVDEVLSTEDITRRIATSAEAGDVRARILYSDLAQRSPDAGGLETWRSYSQDAGLYAAIAEFSVHPEVVNALGHAGTGGTDDPEPTPGSDQDILVAPQEVVTTDVGEPVEISVPSRYDQEDFTGPVDVALFPCTHVPATDSPVTFSDVNGDGFADGIGSTVADQAYISRVNGEPTGGRELYVAGVRPPSQSMGTGGVVGDDDTLRFDVIAGPNADCAVIAVFDNDDGDRQLRVDSQGRAIDPFGVTEVRWQ
ncbi:MAG: hypothetical protein ACLFRV_15655 [Acidimicrobiales bacterium]